MYTVDHSSPPFQFSLLCLISAQHVTSSSFTEAYTWFLVRGCKHNITRLKSANSQFALGTEKNKNNNYDLR